MKNTTPQAWVGFKNHQTNLLFYKVQHKHVDKHSQALFGRAMAPSQIAPFGGVIAPPQMTLLQLVLQNGVFVELKPFRNMFGKMALVVGVFFFLLFCSGFHYQKTSYPVELSLSVALKLAVIYTTAACSHKLVIGTRSSDGPGPYMTQVENN